LQKLTLLLAPMTPHIAEEMWEMLGNTEGLWNYPWPDFIDAQIELAKDDEVEIVVQVNGRVRGKLLTPAGTQQDDMVALAKAAAGVAPHLAGRQLKKIIFVPDKLVNLVVT